MEKSLVNTHDEDASCQTQTTKDVIVQQGLENWLLSSNTSTSSSSPPKEIDPHLEPRQDRVGQKKIAPATVIFLLSAALRGRLEQPNKMLQTMAGRLLQEGDLQQALFFYLLQNARVTVQFVLRQRSRRRH